MKKYKHKKTGDIFVSDPKTNNYHSGEMIVSAKIIENSCDWEEVVEQQYTVIRYVDSVGNIYYRKRNDKFTINLQYEFDEDKLINRELSIQTIRRVSDNVNFSVGDKVVWDWVSCNVKYFTIIKIYRENGTNIMKFKTEHGRDYNIEKHVMSHYKPEALYRSYDGHDIHEGDVFHAVHKDSFNVIENCQYKIDSESNYLIFKSKDKMLEHIWLNKPCLSINDVAKVYVTANRRNTRKDSGWEKQAEQLINIVEKKLKM